MIVICPRCKESYYCSGNNPNVECKDTSIKCICDLCNIKQIVCDDDTVQEFTPRTYKKRYGSCKTTITVLSVKELTKLFSMLLISEKL